MGVAQFTLCTYSWCVTTHATADKSVAEACQRALALALRREAGAAYDLLVTTIAEAELSEEDLRQLADAVYLVGRWTGDFARGDSILRGLVGRTPVPSTRGWITVRMARFARPDDSSEMKRAALGDFTVGGDDAGRAMSMLGLAFPQGDLLPSAAYRLEFVDAAREVGERLGDPVIVARAGNVRAALLTYAGDIDGAEAAYRKVWESFHVASPLLTSEAASSSLNHCFALLSWGRFHDLDGVLDRSRHIVTGPRTRDWHDLIRATVMVYLGQYRAARDLLASMAATSEEVTAFITVLNVAVSLELSGTTPNHDLKSEVEFLEGRSMQLGGLARSTQAELRAVRGEPRPHRDLGPALRRLAASRPRFGWDPLAVTLAELAPDEAEDVLADMWEFWPSGPRPAVQRLFAEALLGKRDPYPSFVQVADRFEANGEFHPAARAMVHASRVAPPGSASLLAHRRALDLYGRTDAERSIAALLRDRRIRREPGAPTIPESQRHAVNPGLTPREREVAQLAAEGMTGREIAERLGISLGTARNHIQRAREKLGGLSKRDLKRLL